MSGNISGHLRNWHNRLTRLLRPVPYLHQFNRTTMPLSNRTTQNLATALSPEVIDYIMRDERWVDFLQEIIPDAIEHKIGGIDEDLKFELSLCIMDKICFKVAS